MAKAKPTLGPADNYAINVFERAREFGFNPVFAEQHPLVKKRIQVRPGKELAPPREVSTYKQSLKNGDQFPPVLVTADGWGVDGNTRTEAADQLGWRFFPAVILDINYEQATELQRKTLKLLGGSMNATHGKRMTPSEFTILVQENTDPDDSPRDIARKLHVPVSMVHTAIASMRAEKKAAELGVDLDGSLTNSHLRLLGGKLRLFTDDVLKELFQLTQDANLTIPELTSLLKRVEEVGTVHEKLFLITDERAGLHQVIKKGRKRPTPAKQLKQKGSYLLDRDAQSMIEEDPRAQHAYMKFLQSMRSQLDKLIDFQAQAMEARGE